MLVLKILGKLVLGFISFFAFLRIIFSLLSLQVPEGIWSALIGFWIIALVCLEIVWLWRKQKPFPRFLAHLRYAPLAVLFFFIAVTILFDAAMIQHSKYKIRAYIYSNTPPEQKVELKLHHNSFRGMCCEGDCGDYARLYGETAREGSSSSNAAVRARSLRARRLIFDLRLTDIDEAERDEDATVKNLGASFRRGGF